MRYSTIQFAANPGWPKAFFLAILALPMGFAAGTADAEKSGAPTSFFDQKFTIALGGFFPRIDSSVSLNPSRGGSGGNISLEDDLGLNSSSASAWVGFSWRFLPRHQIHAEWFQLNRDGSTSANRSFDFGDTTVSPGVSLSSEMDLNLGRVTYGYSIMRREKLDLSFLVGAHIVTAKATVTASGNISVNGSPFFSGSSTESTSAFTFPLPHIGGSISYKFAPKWTAEFATLLFAIDLGDYSGSLVEVDARAAYQLSKHFGIGAGLKYFKLTVQAQKTSGGAEFDYGFFGPAVFGYASF